MAGVMTYPAKAKAGGEEMASINGSIGHLINNGNV